jgi:crotonobetainyl-CoA:carnitine CoA-transferase CaiB-like acyl-CoA transferase
VSSPLNGILVADFSRILAGPLATTTLADLGARVIKVERPGSGDDTRQWGPPYSATGSTYFESVNRNKESVCFDLASHADRALAFELARRADVVVENFGSGVMDAAGLGYEAVRAANPGVVYASISGFGAAAGLPGYDFIVQAVGGLMSVTGRSDGEPLKAGVALVDVLAGKDVAIDVLAALHARAATGVGARLEIALLSSLQAALVNQAQAWLGAGIVPSRLGNAHPSIAPYQTLNCSDGPLAVAVAVGNDAQFGKFCEIIGAGELTTDERFRTNPDRVRHRDTLVALVEARLSSATAPEWESRLRSAGVPAGRVATIAEGFALAHELGLEPTIEVTDATGAVVGTQVRHPVRWSPPLDPRRDAPPTLGEHDAAIRAWLAAPLPGPTARVQH